MPAGEFARIRKTLLPQLQIDPSLAQRAFTFVKQPKVLAALAVCATLATLWYFNQPGKLEKEITLGTTYINGNNSVRQEISNLINKNHASYASRWNLKHEIEDQSLLEGQCTVNEKVVDCEAYWNKIAVLNRWLNQRSPTDKESWYIMVDDDMAITHMGIDPYKAIDELRTKDSSVIIAEDVIPWHGNPTHSVNTGVMIVRRDDTSRDFFNNVWDRRNSLAGKGSSCPTLGVCKQQQTFHEQEAFPTKSLHVHPGLKRERSL